MDPHAERLLALTRRSFLSAGALSIGGIALASLLARTARAERASPLAAKKPPMLARAKRVIFLHMAGAPSQLDLFDPKPKLGELDGRPMPESFTKGERFAFIKGTPTILRSPYAFAKHGQAGHDFSELLPNFARIADD